MQQAQNPQRPQPGAKHDRGNHYRTQTITVALYMYEPISQSERSIVPGTVSRAQRRMPEASESAFRSMSAARDKPRHANRCPPGASSRTAATVRRFSVNPLAAALRAWRSPGSYRAQDLRAVRT